MSYLYSDKIDAEMFLSLFENNIRILEALHLLKQYFIITITRTGGSTFCQIHRLVQAVFQEDEPDILNQVWKLIYPELSKSYLLKQDLPLNLMKQCTTDRLLHYYSLATFAHKLRIKDLHAGFLAHVASLENQWSMDPLSFLSDLIEKTCLLNLGNSK